MHSYKFAHQERVEKRPYKFLGNSRLVPSKQLICQIPTRNSPGRHARAMTPSCACVCAVWNLRYLEFTASKTTDSESSLLCTNLREQKCKLYIPAPVSAQIGGSLIMEVKTDSINQVPRNVCMLLSNRCCCLAGTFQDISVYLFLCETSDIWSSLLQKLRVLCSVPVQQNKITSGSFLRHSKTNLMVH